MVFGGCTISYFSRFSWKLPLCCLVLKPINSSEVVLFLFSSSAHYGFGSLFGSVCLLCMASLILVLNRVCGSRQWNAAQFSLCLDPPVLLGLGLTFQMISDAMRLWSVEHLEFFKNWMSLVNIFSMFRLQFPIVYNEIWDATKFLIFLRVTHTPSPWGWCKKVLIATNLFNLLKWFLCILLAQSLNLVKCNKWRTTIDTRTLGEGLGAGDDDDWLLTRIQ